nr:LPXTG cell wall anchor domain-containing protein [uncultured Mogibacterium sp.]
MRKFLKKFSTVILSAALLLTSGAVLPSVSAAEFNAKPVDARWAAPQEIRVKFDRKLKVNPFPQNRKADVKLLTSDGREVDLGPNDDFGFLNDTIFIRFLAGQKKEYTGVVFKKGSLVDVNDENIKNTEDIRVSNIKVEKTLSRVGIEYEGVPTTNLVPKEGKTLKISASGYNLQLDNGHDIKLKLYSGESGGNTANFKPTNIEATLNVKDNTAGNCYVTIPENRTGKRLGYIFKYSVDGGKTYDDFFKDAPAMSFILIQEADENDAVRPQPTPQPQPVVPTPTPQPAPQPDPVNTEDGYRFTVGNDAVWNGGDLLFKIENPLVDMNQPGERVFDRFQGIEIDGKAVDKENYTAQPGSVVLTLKANYIRSLSTGKHTIKAKFRCGNPATACFTVTGSNKTPKPGTPGIVKKAPVRAKVVKTGDSSSAFAFAIMFVLAGATLAGVVTYRRKRA